MSSRRGCLSCGNHRREEADYRNGCPPCLTSSFEEVCIHARSIGSGRVLKLVI